MPGASFSPTRAGCEALGEAYARGPEVPSDESIDGLLACARLPARDVRMRALDDLSYNGYSRDFPVAQYEKLKAAVARASKDPSFDVRYSAGGLSQVIEHWENFKSPAALARGEAHHLREAAQREKGEIGAAAVLFLLVAGIFVAQVVSWFSTGRGKPKRRR